MRQPRLPDGPVRVGGFGGAAGLAAFLRAEQITAVIDATHPFAGAITANAAQAAAQAEVPLLVLRRPEWEAARPGTWRPISASIAGENRAGASSVDPPEFHGERGRNYLQPLLLFKKKVAAAERSLVTTTSSWFFLFL